MEPTHHIRAILERHGNIRLAILFGLLAGGRATPRSDVDVPMTAAVLANDPDAQDIPTLNPTRMVQLCVDIGAHLIAVHDRPAPDTMGQTFDVHGHAYDYNE